MANETCDSCDENGNILRQEPQVIPKECYIFNNGSTIDTFNAEIHEDNWACGKRILGDKRLSTETMTVDKCIDYCREGNYKYAGL
ncbi:unnamed protein product [Rhizophagus irregularis]|nr:unnamed protein product [Rhizophagus irregularis]CAB5359422.1 unnamed protein product [Rhizophagus irregularis]